MGERDGQQQGEGGFFQGLKKKVQDQGWLDKAREEVGDVAGKLGQQAQQLGNRAREMGQNGDWQGLASEAGKVIQKQGVGGIAGTLLSPQTAVLGFGANAVGDFVGKRQAKTMLDNPQQLGERLVADFDSTDRNKNGFVDGEDLKGDKGGGIGDLLSGGKGSVSPYILDKAYSKFAAFDGEDADKGVSRKDVELFNLVQNDKAVAEKVSEDAWSSAKLFGGLSGAAGLAAGAFGVFGRGASPMGTALRIGLPAVTAAVAGGAISYKIKESSSESFYADRKDEAEKMVQWLKREL